MDHTRIGEIMPGFPSEQAGIQVGDEILKVNGFPVTKWREMSEKIRTEGEKNEEINFEIKRGEEILTLTVKVPNNNEYPTIMNTAGQCSEFHRLIHVTDFIRLSGVQQVTHTR